MEIKYLILGGGITGLSFAAGIHEDDYCILEKENTVGGYCRTIREKGFIWDYAGHFFHFSDSDIKVKFEDLLNSNEIIYSQKNTKIYYKGKYIDYPFQHNIHQLSKEEFIDCLTGLFEAQENKEPTDFEDMLYKKYGEAISNKFLIPYNEKLYACSLNTLDINAMGRFFPKAKPEEIVKGFRGKQKKTYNDEFLYPKEGAAAFVDVICRGLNKEKILVGAEVLKVDIQNKEVYTQKGIFRYKYLINTMPLDAFLKISEIKHSIDFSANQVLVFNLGFDNAPEDIAYHWIYYPDKDLCFYRVGFYNNILRDNRMSLYVELGFPRGQEIRAELWKERVLCDLRKVGIINGQNLVAENHVLMSPAYVHITEESQKGIGMLKDELGKKNVFSIGRYGSWRYCSIEDCIRQADNLRVSLMEK